MADPKADDRTICTLAEVRPDGSFLWSVEARRLARGFSVLIWDLDSIWRWRLTKSIAPYTWRRFATILCEWQQLASHLEYRVDFSWISSESKVVVLGESSFVATILRLCFSEGDCSLTRWLIDQSDASIAILNTAFSNLETDVPPGALQGILDCIEELQLPAELPALLRHYGIDEAGQGLIALNERLTKDMTSLLAIRAARVAKFQSQIATLASDADDRPRRAAGMGFPSRRARLTEYLTDFVARNDALPTGIFEGIDLDELRRKHQL